jgi:PTS system mannitol-specific IIC component
MMWDSVNIPLNRLAIAPYYHLSSLSSEIMQYFDNSYSSYFFLPILPYISSKQPLFIDIQRVGRFLSGMVLPNIGAFIAWGLITALLLGAGLIAPPSPGSIFAYIIMSPKGGFIPVMMGVLVSAAVSFLVASLFIKRSKEFSGEALNNAQTAIKEMKAVSKGLAVPARVKKIIFACDAGMGSSAMGASTLRSKLKKAGLDIEVANCAIEDIPDDADIVISHESLRDRAKSAAPQAEHISIKNFINCPEYDELVKRLS